MYVYSHLMVDLKLELNCKSFVIEGKNKHLLDVIEPRFTELPEEVVVGLFNKYLINKLGNKHADWFFIALASRRSENRNW